MVKINIYLGLLFIFIACSSPKKNSLQYSSITPVNSTVSNSSDISKTIAPYKAMLDEEMNEVIGQASVTIQNEQKIGESSLGNFVADLMLYQSRKLYKDTVHFSIINAHGGLRTPIEKGAITVGEIFELMPFDNEMLVVDIKGDEVYKMLDISAQSGVNVFSPIRFHVINNSPDSVMISGVPIYTDSTYKMAISDYLANGGGGFDFLQDNKRYELNILLRDMIIKHIKELQSKGKRVAAKKDGRITILKPENAQ